MLQSQIDKNKEKSLPSSKKLPAKETQSLGLQKARIK